MSVKRIKMSDLSEYEGREGLILQGCGGDPQEWVDGINKLLTERGCLIDNSKFSSDNCAVFDNNGLTCILFEFTDDVKMDMGKLAMWRLVTHSSMGGTWLTDFVDNRLGGFRPQSQTSQQKPDCALIGQDGNIFNLLGLAAKTLRENGMSDQAKEMTKRITDTAHSYGEALNIVGEYVNITSADDMDEDIDESEGMEMCYE